MSRDSKLVTVLDAVAAVSAGNYIDVQDYKTITLAFNTAGTANMTVKFAGSISDDSPTVTSARSAANQWDYVDVIDLEDGSSIDGDTGIVLSAADDNRMLEVNVNGLKWFTAHVTARSAGSVTLKARTFGDS